MSDANQKTCEFCEKSQMKIYTGPPVNVFQSWKYSDGCENHHCERTNRDGSRCLHAAQDGRFCKEHTEQNLTNACHTIIAALKNDRLDSIYFKSNGSKLESASRIYFNSFRNKSNVNPEKLASKLMRFFKYNNFPQEAVLLIPQEYRASK